MKKNLITILFIISFFFNAEAQLSYSFSYVPPVSGAYQEITSDSIVTSYPTSGLFMVNDVLGETFYFFGLPFTFGGLKTLSFGPSGFLRVDNDSSLIIIDGANMQLSLIDSTSKVSYVIEGSSGSLLFKLQYKNVRLNNGPAGNFANFQIWYYQSTADIEIHYGPRSANNASGYTASNGPQVGIFYAPHDFSACYEKMWCTVNPSNPVLNTTPNFSFSALPGVPDEGFIYKFTPTFSVAVTEFTDSKFILAYPNPAQEFLVVNNNHISASEMRIVIYDLQGKEMASYFTRQKGYKLNIEFLAAGAYVCEVFDGNKKQKLIFSKTR